MRTRTWQWLVIVGSMALVAFTSLAVSRTPFNVTITPDDESSGTKYVNTSGHTASFTITYGADELDPEEGFSLWCDGTQGIQCSVQSSIVLYPNSPQNVNVTFSTGSSTGTGYVNLYAYGWTTSFQDQGSRFYTISEPVTVNPLSVPSSVIQHGQDQTATFTVTNNTGSQKTYTMTCEWGAGACTPSPSSKVLPASQSFTDTVTFDAGAVPAAYDLKLTATSGAETGYEQQSVTVSEFLSVNAVAQNAQVYAAPNTQRADSFVVRFPGQPQTLFAMSVSCPGISCSVPAASDTMDISDTPVKVPVTYTPGNNGTTSTVTVTATKVGTSWITNGGSLSVTATSSILLSVDDANHGMELNRGECLTVAAGAGAIVCEDYQFVYALTGVSRMNRSHQLQLINNSGLAAAMGRIGANVVLPPGVSEPDSLRITLVMNTDTVRTQSYAASLYVPGQKTRFALDWDWASVPVGEQLPVYKVIVQPWVGGSPQASVQSTGKLVSISPLHRFARAWWIAGLEKLAVHGDTLVWLGPDAGGAAYLKSGSLWIRQSRTMPDTIVQSGSTYVRKLLGGGEVRFNSSGFHTTTVDRNGNETLFHYYTTPAGLTLVSSIAVPTPSAADTIYRLFHASSNGALDSILVRSASGGWLKYRFYSTDGPTGLVMDSITAPDGVKTRMVSPYGMPQSIYGPRGDTTSITYAYNTVSSVTVKSADVDDVVLDFRAASTIGRETSGWRAPAHVDSISSRVDGPLSGAADTTRFFTTAWGGVRGIRDALGSITWIDRQDAAFPALPTRVRHPNGWQVTTAYTPGGLPDTIIDRSTGAVTTYAWNTTWRVPTIVTSPEGIVTTFTYDGNGNQTTQTHGTFKDSLHYNADYLVDAAVDAAGNVSEFGYDSFGNLQWEEDPLNHRTRYLRDYLGRDTLAVTATNSSGDSIRAKQRYDVMSRPTTSVTRNDLDEKWDSTVTTYDATTGDRIKVEAWGGSTAGAPTDTIGASEWFYDDLGRVTVARTPVTADTMQYDLAGNLTKTISNGDTVSMMYDVLGRLTSRRTSGKFYSYGQTVNGWYFPVFETSGLTIAAATDTFTYDVMGNLLTANNPYSQITQIYALNGALKTDQQAIKNYGSGSLATHVFQLAYAYNRDGQRAATLHPTWLSPGTDRTDYFYHGTTGRLSSVKDALGDVYAFTYDANGQPMVMTFPSGVDSLTYDGDGQATAIKARTGPLGSIVNDAITYDPADRILGDWAQYHGSGPLKSAELDNPDITQYFDRDAFGNARIEQDWLPGQSPGTPGSKWVHDYPARLGGRLGASEGDWEFGSVSQPLQWEPNQAERSYDLRGNLDAVQVDEYTWQYSGGGNGYLYADIETNYRSYSKSYYASDGRLRVHQINRDSVSYLSEYGPPWGAYEEYWYDALGRRIMKRSRQESPICTDSNRCYSSIERYVWDGDQILLETRQANAGDVANPTHGTQTGYVSYVDAGALDAPIGMIRNNAAVILHRNWRGLVVDATSDTGARVGSDVYWPGVNWDAQLGYQGARNVTAWYGSLPMDMQDRTGLTYKRNRYYDPSSGQFTQPDPIGMAGGINIYGYAAGDPINFADPFGLCPVCFTAGRALTSVRGVYSAGSAGRWIRAGWIIIKTTWGSWTMGHTGDNLPIDPIPIPGQPGNPTKPPEEKPEPDQPSGSGPASSLGSPAPSVVPVYGAYRMGPRRDGLQTMIDAR